MAALRRSIRVMLVVTALALLAGCGKKGALIPPEALAPAPVADLALAQKGAGFQLSWTAPGRQEGGATLRDLAGFLLFRRMLLPPAEDCEECPTAYSRLARIDLDYPQGVRRAGDRFLFDDFDLKSGKSYQYKLRSFRADGTQSRDSNKVRRSAAIPPRPPVVQAQSTATGVVLSFEAPAPEAGSLIGYNIYRGKKGGEMPLSPINSAPVTGTGYEDRDLLVGESYSYTVTAVAALNGVTVESAPSNLAEGAISGRD